MKKSGALAGKNKMSNQTGAAVGAIATSVNWERQGLDLQAIIQAANQGRLGKSLTDWLVSQSWNQGKFIARNAFRLKSEGGLCSYVGENFQNWFSGIVQEIEILLPIKSIILEVPMLDKDIILKLGGLQHSISGLQDLSNRMEVQPKGPKSPAGDLPTNGNVVIAYIPQPVTKVDEIHFTYIDRKGQIQTEQVVDPQYLFEVGGKWYVLRTVRVVWDDVGWRVGASSVELPLRWLGGFQVFSRNSVLESSEPSAPAQA